MLSSLWQQYTKEVLAWQLGKATLSHTKDNNTKGEEQALKLMLHAQKQPAFPQYFVVLGIDDALIIALEQELDKISQNSHILVIESNITKARAFFSKKTKPRTSLLADTSPWALFLLTRAAGLLPQDCLIHFAQKPKERCPILQNWRKLFLGAQKYTPEVDTSVCIQVGAILHPNEPQLEDFFLQLPEWIEEVIAVWDMPEGSTAPIFACAAKVHNYIRPLQQDFAAQRNALLHFCREQSKAPNHTWIIMLDADERLSPNSWAQLPKLCDEKFGAVVFPRHTFEGTNTHIRMGYGLWPDVQLRLFPLNDTVHFQGSIHEKVMGITKPQLFCPHIPLLHYSHISKNFDELQNRLEVFNAAGQPKHTLSAAYPYLYEDFFAKLLPEMKEHFILPQ